MQVVIDNPSLVQLNQWNYGGGKIFIVLALVVAQHDPFLVVLDVELVVEPKLGCWLVVLDALEVVLKMQVVILSIVVEQDHPYVVDWHSKID